ncbi:hypothetical protein QQ054_01010 [Oscillatoria amoena NRMC-F 0135]|nr:hypothetical protein [Oscillatoria amoena NRMC-F 0135]
MADNPENNPTPVNSEFEDKNPILSIRFLTVEDKKEFASIIKARVNKGKAKNPGEAALQMARHCKESIFFITE